MSSDEQQLSQPTVIDGWVIVDGCKVGRVPEPGIIAFKDDNRARNRQKGCDQRKCKVADLARAVESAEPISKQETSQRGGNDG